MLPYILPLRLGPKWSSYSVAFPRPPAINTKLQRSAD